MVTGARNCLLSAILTIVPRRILPDRVLGKRSTTQANLKAATGPVFSHTNLNHIHYNTGMWPDAALVEA